VHLALNRPAPSEDFSGRLHGDLLAALTLAFPLGQIGDRSARRPRTQIHPRVLGKPVVFSSRDRLLDSGEPGSTSPTVRRFLADSPMRVPSACRIIRRGSFGRYPSAVSEGRLSYATSVSERPRSPGSRPPAARPRRRE